MADEESSKDIERKIVETYIPFLRKLLDGLEKKKNEPKAKASFEKVSYVYQTFTEGDTKEKVDVYKACKGMLEKWFEKYKSNKTKQSHTPSSPSCVSEDSQSEAPSSKTESPVPIAIVSVQSYANTNFKEQQDGVYFQNETANESNTILPVTTASSVPTIPIAKIKKEKIDPPRTNSASTGSHSTTHVSPKPVQVVTAQPAVVQVQEEEEEESPEKEKELIFVCASCQFRTTVEADFMKHARTDHRTDLSLWCKNCGKCFSNAGVLVSHIKEANCQKEDMIYRCGVKDCTFETPSGQTFVHHLRHCHKGSPFIFCVHCQKIFTLPHCLILHMQNECPFKDRNRKTPGQTPSSDSTPTVTAPVASKPVKPATPPVKPPVAKPAPTPNATKTPTPAVNKPSPVPASTPASTRGRGRGPGRGRWPRSSRSRYTDSSDSEDPDDPSWRPEETASTQPVRRSARWAKKVSEAKDPDIEVSNSKSSHKKSIIEEPTSKIYFCPCCDFSAAFNSLLRDHYVASHKHEKRLSCLVCNVKFENVDSFVNHFETHERDKEKKQIEKPRESSVDSPANKNGPNVVAQKEHKVQPAAADLSEIPLENVPGNCPKASDRNGLAQIPYQTAIHERLQKDSKIKSFEDLKSAGDVEKMKSEPKLKHFYKCAVYSCTFTTDDEKFYRTHLTERHKDKKLNCTYCFNEFGTPSSLVEHMLKEHAKRCYQCSMCFYRAFSKAHVQIHIRNSHTLEKPHIYTCSQHLPPNFAFHEEENTNATTYPYRCAIGDCEFQTYDPKDFIKHNDATHRSVSQFFCYYCKGDFISLKRLISHYHLHGINNFQCVYCVHGSETRDEILLHLCNSHADRSFKVHVRAPQDADTGTNKTFEMTNKTCALPAVNLQPKPSSTSEKKATTNTSSIVFKRNYSGYPNEVLCLDEDFFCRLVSCGKECKNFEFYLNHLKDDHGSVNIPCPYCAVVCYDADDFCKHMMCHGPNLYACPKGGCYYYSFNKDDVTKHMLDAHKLEAAVKTIRHTIDFQLVSFKLDIQMVSEYKSDTYICPFCYYQNGDYKEMKNHIYLELAYKRFQCNICKEKMCSRGEVKEHFTSSHPHHNLKCAINNNSEVEFYAKCFLTPDVQKLFKDYVNGKVSGSGNILSFSSSYSCDQCSLDFSDISEWQHHWSYCILKSNQPYICNFCTEKFSDLTHLKYHTNKDHGGRNILYTLTENVFLKQTTNRKLQLGKVQFLKTLLSPYLKGQNLSTGKLKSFESKYYKCGYCNFNDSFRGNIKKHLDGCHKDQCPKTEKVKRDLDIPGNFNPKSSSSTEVSKDEKVDQAVPKQEIKPYSCGFCTEKSCSLEDLENHVESHHAVPGSDTYPFFYLPDPKWEFSPKDVELYECAYCSVSQENLFHLKRHCNNLHYGVPFKVRGMRSKSSSIFICEQCGGRFVTLELLNKHSLFHHPKAPKPSKKEEPTLKRKITDETDVPLAKVSKGDYQCHYCRKPFPFYIQLTTHLHDAHQDKPVKIVKGSKNTEIELVQCDFCPYLAGYSLMNTHLSTKHNNCFVCGYCGKGFNGPTEIVSHIQADHKGQPVSVIKVSDISLISEGESENSVASTSANNDDMKEGQFSFYGTKPSSVNLHNITVNLTSTVKSSTDAHLPVIYLSQMFPMFPNVLVEDIRNWS